MPDEQVREISSGFEVGGHTLNHVVLNGLTSSDAQRQIDGSKRWLEDVTGRECTAFCPPLGRFGTEHLPMIRRAGFRVARTVELLSVDYPRPREGLFLVPTSVQAHPHGAWSYTKNALRRRSARNLWRCAVDGRSKDWVRLSRALLERVLKHGGVFHLWGHSWEIEEFGQWAQLEEVLGILRSNTAPACRIRNGALAGNAAVSAVSR